MEAHAASSCVVWSLHTEQFFPTAAHAHEAGDCTPYNTSTFLLRACRVKDLARLSLQNPEYVSVHADATTATPQRLKQFYISVPLHRKLDLLWFFIKTHLKKRTVVFFSTCKQVRCPSCKAAWLLHPTCRIQTCVSAC
jgi:hypothetical protein